MDPIIKGTSAFKHFQRKSSASKFAETAASSPSFGLALARFPPAPAAAGQRAWPPKKARISRQMGMFNRDPYIGLFEIYITW